MRATGTQFQFNKRLIEIPNRPEISHPQGTCLVWNRERIILFPDEGAGEVDIFCDLLPWIRTERTRISGKREGTRWARVGIRKRRSLLR